MELEQDLAQNFSISEFKNFMAIPLSCPESKHISHLHVFSNPAREPESRNPTSNFCNSTTKKKVKRALELFDFIHFSTLVQFWAPTISENQQEFLDASDIPFALGFLRKGLCLYRKKCLKHRYSLDGGGSGPPGRAYRRRFPEFCPDVRYYSAEEYELKGCAVDIGVRGYLSLPVFEPDGQFCVGVLEILTIMDGSFCLNNVIHKVSDALKEVGLKSSDVFWPFDMKQLGHPEYEPAINEIQDVLAVLCEQHNLPFSQTWVVMLDERSGESVMSTAKRGSYMSIKKVSSFQSDCSWFHLRKGQGIVWKAFSSGTSSFCRDVTHLNINDYALVLGARKAGLTGAFAICLQSTYTGNTVYVIELFLPPDKTNYRQPWNFLESLLVTMKQQFKTFKLSSGQEVGNELPVAVLKISSDDQLDSFVISETMHAGESLKKQGDEAQLMSFHPLIFEEVGPKKHGPEEGNENTPSSSSLFKCCQNGEMAESQENNTENRRNVLNSQQILSPSLTKDGAMGTLCLGDQVSTENKSGKGRTNFPGNPSVNKFKSRNLRPRKERKVHRTESSQRHETCCVSPLGESFTSVSSLSQGATPMQNKGSILTVKADYEGDIIKFQVPVASGMMKLKGEVMKRIKLTAGAFEIKYRREDGIWILLDSDAKLQDYVNVMRSSGISTIKLSIVSIVSHTETIKDVVKITVKASYKEDLIKFQIPLSAGMLELKNEIIKRLKLDYESFEIKYTDENNCQILLDNDAALKTCISKVTSLQKNMMRLSIQQTAVSNDCLMTMKAFYGDDIIKFQLSLSSGMMNLKKEVTKRLKLEAGNFVVKCKDGNTNEILLDGDAALTEYMNTMKSMGVHTAKLSLQPIKQ